MNDDSEPEFHEPTDEAVACLTLELYRPERFGEQGSHKQAWQDLRAAHRSVGQAVQRGVGDIVVHVRDLRASGKTRFPVAAERANAKLGIPLPSDCYTEEDMQPFVTYLTDALKASGVSEYVYASIARRITGGELSGDKLRGLLRGEQAYPVMRNVGVMMRGRNWRAVTEPRIANGKEYVDIVIETSALRPGAGKMRFVCKSLHGPRLKFVKELIHNLSALEWSTGVEGGWSKGALTIRPLRRPGQPEKWFLMLPYTAPRAVAIGGGDRVVVAVHRSVANMLTAAVSGGETYHFPGRDIVLLKHQMYARRAKVQRDLEAAPHRRRGKRAHYKAVVRLADKEKRATQTHLWRAARWAQTIAENAGASLVLIDDFGAFDPDVQEKWIAPYVRRFPFADLKTKIVDAITRRAGVPVQEIKSRYISQECPECGYTAAANIVKLPHARGVDVESGYFRCGGDKCKFSGDLDVVAALNLLKRHETQPEVPKVSAG